MRDTTHRRKAIDAQRAELLAAWERPIDLDRARRACDALAQLLKEERAVAITIPVPEDTWPADKVYPPSADNVAAAILAACRETGADFERLCRGDADRDDKHFKISRARVYAALAIRAIFPENSAPGIARMVASGYPDTFLAQVDGRMKKNDLKWFDNDAFMRVVAATEESV